MKDFLLNNYSLLTRVFQASALITGYIYYSKNRDHTLRFFILYLAVTLVVEFIGYYPRLMLENYDNNLFISFKNTLFCDNYWLYNVYLIVNISLLTYYFKGLIVTPHFKRGLAIVFVLFLIFSAAYWWCTGTFMYAPSMYNFIFGASVVMVGAFMYYYETISSENVLGYYSNIHFYILLILLAWHIIITPLFIFGSFYNINNPSFVEFRRIVLLSSNIIMYLSFTLCFIVFFYKARTY